MWFFSFALLLILFLFKKFLLSRQFKKRVKNDVTPIFSPENHKASEFYTAFRFAWNHDETSVFFDYFNIKSNKSIKKNMWCQRSHVWELIVKFKRNYKKFYWCFAKISSDLRQCLLCFTHLALTLHDSQNDKTWKHINLFSIR